MKLSFKKFVALVVSLLMLASLTVVADTTAANEPEKDAVAVEALVTSDAVVASDSEEDILSDAEDVIASDAEDAITSDAEEIVPSDAEEIVPSDSQENASSDEEIVSSDSQEAVSSDATITEDADISYTDLSSDDWAYDAILNLSKKGIVSGDTAGTIRPDGNVTREEVAKMMVVARRFAVSQDTSIEAADSSSVSEWAKGYFKTAMEKGIINGYTDGTVRGTGAVNRAEMATIIVRSINASVDSFAASSFTDITENDWYARYVECAKTLGIVNGYYDGSFAGENLVTRREAFAMIERMVRLLEALEA